MIQCYINNTPGYPDIQSEIKVTKENPFVANGDSFTMDVIFPMSVPENAALFGNLHRMDVSKRIQVFDDCQLYADNLLLIRGSGRVTEVTETTVKLQILGGYNNIRYQSAFQKVFIDRIDNYPRVADKYRPKNVYNKWWDNIAISGVWVEDEVAQKGMSETSTATCSSPYTMPPTGLSPTTACAARSREDRAAADQRRRAAEPDDGAPESPRVHGIHDIPE